MIVAGIDTMKWANMIKGCSSIEEVRRVQKLRIAEMRRDTEARERHAAWKALPFWRRWLTPEPLR